MTSNADVTAQRYLYFFFSSRRRHTRFDCDWSSDVCSSDLSSVSNSSTKKRDFSTPPASPDSEKTGNAPLMKVSWLFSTAPSGQMMSWSKPSAAAERHAILDIFPARPRAEDVPCRVPFCGLRWLWFA